MSKSRTNLRSESSPPRSAGGGRSDRPRRRRRKPEAAESEILDAAESLLRERPFREMTVDDVMSRTGLSRPSFYEYFRDRHHLVMKLTERLGEWSYTASQQWLTGAGDPLEDLRVGIDKLIGLYETRGYLLRALADAASHDKQVESAYRAMLRRFIDATALRIREGIRAGTMKDIDPDEVATALILMNERYLIERMGHAPQADPKAARETLLAVWKRVLYAL